MHNHGIFFTQITEKGTLYFKPSNHRGVRDNHGLLAKLVLYQYSLPAAVENITINIITGTTTNRNHDTMLAMPQPRAKADFSDASLASPRCAASREANAMKMPTNPHSGQQSRQATTFKVR